MLFMLLPLIVLSTLAAECAALFIIVWLDGQQSLSVLLWAVWAALVSLALWAGLLARRIVHRLWLSR